MLAVLWPGALFAQDEPPPGEEPPAAAAEAGQEDEAAVEDVQQLPPNLPPVVHLRAIQYKGRPPLVVTLDASDSYDPDGELTSYEWCFDGRLANDIPSQPTCEMVLASPGVHSIGLYAYDDRGGSGFAQVYVLVTSGTGLAPSFPPANNAPWARLDVQPFPGQTWHAPLWVTYDMTGCRDEDGHLVLYELDTDGDGSFDEAGDLLLRTSREFTEPGTYTARLRVTDDGGALAMTQLVFTVLPPEPVEDNKPPVAILAASATRGRAPLTVTLDARESYDLDSYNLACQWDWEGDPEFDPSQPGRLKLTYSDPGKYTVTVTITDNLGAANSASVEITVLK
jgi:hypothetical protein